MHFTLESLNHILTVITVTAFLYSRKDFFQDILRSNLIPGKLENNVHIIFGKIEQNIRHILNKNKQEVLGIESPVYDFESPEMIEILKVKRAAQKIRDEYTVNEYNRLKIKQDTTIHNINTRFSNTSFFIALISFFLLILAAGFHHVDFVAMEIFMIFYNVINIGFLLTFSFKKRRVSNSRVIIYFLFSIAASYFIPLVIFKEAALNYYNILHESSWANSVVHILYNENAYSFVLFVALLTLLSPWIIGFLHFLFVYLFTSGKLRKLEKPCIDKLILLENFLKTKQEMLQDNEPINEQLISTI